MNIYLKINPDELGRFLLAYYRGIFSGYSLGKAFLLYYGIAGYRNLILETDDEKALEFIKGEFLK